MVPAVGVAEPDVAVVVQACSPLGVAAAAGAALVAVDASPLASARPDAAAPLGVAAAVAGAAPVARTLAAFAVVRAWFPLGAPGLVCFLPDAAQVAFVALLVSQVAPIVLVD